MRKLIVQNFGTGVVSGSPDAGVAGTLDTANDILVADVRGQENIAVIVQQIVDLGTAAISVEGSVDGITWFLLTGGALTDASFPAGANTGVYLGVSDARGMALPMVQVRARLTAVAGGGTYRLQTAGLLPSQA